MRLLVKIHNSYVAVVRHSVTFMSPPSFPLVLSCVVLRCTLTGSFELKVGIVGTNSPQYVKVQKGLQSSPFKAGLSLCILAV